MNRRQCEAELARLRREHDAGAKERERQAAKAQIEKERFQREAEKRARVATERANREP